MYSSIRTPGQYRRPNLRKVRQVSNNNFTDWLNTQSNKLNATFNASRLQVVALKCQLGGPRDTDMFSLSLLYSHFNCRQYLTIIIKLLFQKIFQSGKCGSKQLFLEIYTPLQFFQFRGFQTLKQFEPEHDRRVNEM